MQTFTLSVQEEDCLKVFAAFKPKITKDGDTWCCLYGTNLQEGIVGFGGTPMAALYKFCVALFETNK